MQLSYAPYLLRFAETAITSRQAMTVRPTWIIRFIPDDGKVYYGEAAMFPGLSCDDRPDFERVLAEACHAINREIELPDLTDFPAIKIALESIIYSARNDNSALFFKSPFTRGETDLTINGLIWMGSKEQMLRRIDEKIKAGFRTLKLKIGGIDFVDEEDLLQHIRDAFPADKLTIRLDANGSLGDVDTALTRLDLLSRFDIHSIEQPIKAGQPKAMGYICRHTPIPVALDEELIGINRNDEREELLDTITPHYIIIKPTLHGGFVGGKKWIDMATERNIGWWITSALESNIGLNAIAQWAAHLGVTLPQGLGTGALYTNNFPTGLRLDGERMSFNTSFNGFDLSDYNLQWITP
ncbi:MAG: o-succinylbenzoate synthase [Muribaculaceae bacterium]|nr:o-succinylbenzoate synthase [Muribaculaceae bacterium]